MSLTARSADLIKSNVTGSQYAVMDDTKVYAWAAQLASGLLSELRASQNIVSPVA